MSDDTDDDTPDLPDEWPDVELSDLPKGYNASLDLGTAAYLHELYDEFSRAFIQESLDGHLKDRIRELHDGRGQIRQQIRQQQASQVDPTDILNDQMVEQDGAPEDEDEAEDDGDEPEAEAEDADAPEGEMEFEGDGDEAEAAED